MSEAITKVRSKNTSYYINSVIGVCIMLFFGYLPTFSTVTPMGMKILGIYIGLLYLWSTVDLIWPSLLGLIVTGFSGYNSVSGLLSAGWGDGTNVYILCLLYHQVRRVRQYCSGHHVPEDSQGTSLDGVLPVLHRRLRCGRPGEHDPCLPYRLGLLPEVR